MFPRYVLYVLACRLAIGLSLPATYDQRQTGDLNVQVHVKDVQILALVDSELLDDYTEYDYFYDYNDFTVKPIDKPSTGSTTSIKPTDAPSQATVDSSSQVIDFATSAAENATADDAKVPPTVEATTTTSPGSTENSSVALKTRINDKTGNLFEEDDATSTANGVAESSTEKPARQLSRKRCRSGYTPDGKGRCRRSNQRRVSLIPFAMKLAPKFLGELTYGAKNLGL